MLTKHSNFQRATYFVLCGPICIFTCSGEKLFPWCHLPAKTVESIPISESEKWKLK